MDACTIGWTEEEIMLDIQNLRCAIELLFNNSISDAFELLADKKTNKPFCQIGYCAILFVNSILLYEKELFTTSMQTVNQSIEHLNEFKKKRKLRNITNYSNPAQFNSGDYFLEIIFATAELIHSVLSLLEAENFITFVKAAYRVHKAFKTFKSLDSSRELIIQQVIHEETIKEDFNSLVLLGNGVFNLIFALLPPKIASVASLAGLQGKLDIGHYYLLEGYDSSGVASGFCGLAYCTYAFIVCYHIGTNLIPIESPSKVLDCLKKDYQESGIVMLLCGRRELYHGNFEQCSLFYQNILNIKIDPKHIQYLCYNELGWISGVTGDFDTAENHLSFLIDNTNWSKVLYSYAKCCLKITKHGKDDDNINSEVDKEFLNLPTFMKTIAGKEIPFEKFCIIRSKMFLKNHYLPVPFHELIYFLNMFNPISKNEKVLKRVSDELQMEHKRLMDASTNFGIECLMICSFLLAALYTCIDELEKAEPLLLLVIENRKKIVESKHLPSFSYYELAKIERKRKNFKLAMENLRKAKNIASGYVLEYTLLVKVDSLILDLKNDI